jgi:hypothetical protein
MWRIFENYPEALKNVAGVSERCWGAVKLTGKTHMPSVLLPRVQTAEKR